MLNPVATPSGQQTPIQSTAGSGSSTPTHAAMAAHFSKAFNVSPDRLGSTRRNSMLGTMPAKQAAQAKKHVDRLDSILEKLQIGVDKARQHDFKGSVSDVHLSAVADKLTSLRNLWAGGQLSGTHRWVRIGAPVIHWQRASGERLVAKALASLEKSTKVDANGYGAKSGAAFDYYVNLGSLHEMKL
ncbi:MAG TPA: hypothetical protein VGO76_15680 [Luteibacter sp.]|jgi:hypothetical protein|nr:hypothetical protein [Luteibacter sp.]